MDLSFAPDIVGNYKSGLQRAKNWSEHWASRNCYCPNCGASQLRQTPANTKVEDFVCFTCGEGFELKAQARMFGRKIVDGAYGSMMARLNARNNPNLILLHYDKAQHRVENLILIPKYFFVPDMVVAKRPLGPHARRAGWIGCNILLDGVPQSGRIHVIRDQVVIPKADVMSSWRHTKFLAESNDLNARGWLLALIRCIEKIGAKEFSIQDVYKFENDLQAAYPDNQHIRAKIRQKLQVLRDKHYLVFLGGGRYSLA
jgi:type II restriction enzyme